MTPSPLVNNYIFHVFFRDSPNNTSDPTSQFASSSVYYMMKPGALPTPWRMHQSDELLLFHLGGSVKVNDLTTDM